MNGVYDIACALSLLHIIDNSTLRNLHINMINKQKYNINSKILERMLAYWILTYGIIRVSDHYLLIACSYYMEAIGYTIESIHNTVHMHKAMIVVYSCIVLGGVCNYLCMYPQ